MFEVRKPSVAHVINDLSPHTIGHLQHSFPHKKKIDLQCSVRRSSAYFPREHFYVFACLGYFEEENNSCIRPQILQENLTLLLYLLLSRIVHKRDHFLS